MPRSPSITLILLQSLLLFAVVTQIVASLTWGRESWQMTEWLINYSGGFVRRGLPGTLIGMLAECTGLRANLIVIITSVACYLVLTAWLLRRACVSFHPGLILSCMVMGIPAYQDSIIRKDCLGLLLLLACILLGGSRGPRSLRVVGLNLIASAAILCHETFAFYGLAAYVFFRDPAMGKPWLAQAAERAVTLIPAGLCFLLTTIYHGTPAHAVAIHNSWITLWDSISPGHPGHSEPQAAIAALGWTTQKGMSLSLHMLTSGSYQPIAWAMVFVISFLLILIFTGHGLDQKSQEKTRIRFVSILVSQLVFISPLFILGVDYGRWLFLCVASSMMFHVLNRRAPDVVESIAFRLFTGPRVAALMKRMPAREWYLLVFGVPVCWNLLAFLSASPIGRHLEMILSWL